MRMADVSSLDERSLEVLDIPEDVDDDLLMLYFENKRRSGGGDVVSLVRHGNKAVVVFEEADVAARILAKSHVLQESRLTVRKKPPKDPGKLLLRGLNPNTSLELVELYVENLTGMESDVDFALYLSPSKDLVLIQLHARLSKDFQTLCDKVSKKGLDGAKISLEQVESTDSIIVANLTPNLTEDMLELYFGSRRGGEVDVLGVTMLTEGYAKVSFNDVKSVDCVLQKSHNLEGTDLIVKPYFDFLQAVVDESTVRSHNGQGTLSEETDLIETRLSSVSAPSPTASDPMTGTILEHSVALANNVTSLVSSTATSSKVEPMDTDPSSPKESCSFTSVTESTKLKMLSLSNLPENLMKAHPNFEVSLKKDGVQIKGPDQLEVERLKSKVLEILSGIAQAHLTYDTIKAGFLGREDVKKRLHLSLKCLPSTYSVSDCMVTVTSLSHSGVKQACDLIESQISEFSVPIDREYESVVFSQECSDFLGSLDFCNAKVSDTGEMITAFTLKGMEKENQEKVVQFLSTPIQRETVLTMEPGLLTFLQLHHQDLLADMGEVIFFPLETGDGLSIQGDLNACQMAEEVLRSVISTTCSKCIVVSQPGISRFLLEEEGANILAEMTAKFQVYISMEKVHWEPLEDKDIFELAWKMTPCQNFLRSSSENSVQDFTVGAPVVSNINATDAHTSAGIEEAKRILSIIGSDLTPEPSSLGATDMEEVDLYSDQAQDASAMQEDISDQPQALQAVDIQSSSIPMNACSLEEDARLMLAIQLSMEINQRTDADDLQKALELSKSESMSTAENIQLEKAVMISLQDTIKASNTAEIFVYANYKHDLARVDIALRKKVGLRHCEEKFEHKFLRKISSHQKRCIEFIKRKHAVDINIQGTTAIISGFKDYVSEAVIELKNFLKRAANMMSDDAILKTVQWVWHELGSTAVIPYPPDAIVFIENAWKMKEKKIDILFNNHPYSIDFEKMEEYSLASGKTVSIKRNMLRTEDLCTDDTEEDNSLLSNMPEVSEVDEDSDEFQKVIKDFYDTIQEHHNRIKIVKVEKLKNRLLYDQYRLMKASMERSSSVLEVERTLYHGTNENSVKEICIHGFNRSFCGKNATVYGQGVYFAVNSALSVLDTYSPPNADSHKFIFVARVLTGDFTVGQHAMKAAPLKENSTIPVRYHSVTDKISDPTLFVIFNDTQAYPEYLITCKKIYR